MKLYLREADRLERMRAAERAKLVRLAVWAEADDFERAMEALAAD